MSSASHNSPWGSMTSHCKSGGGLHTDDKLVQLHDTWRAPLFDCPDSGECMRRCLPCVLLCLTAPATKAGENWPQFRGPNVDGVSDARSIPTRWSESENIRWKTAIHDKGWSSPVVWGEQIWMTTAREDGREFCAVCVDRKSGKILHDVKVFSEEKPAYCHPFNSYASPTPVVEEGRVYVHFGTHGTACLDTATGKVLWTREDMRVNHYRGPGSSPIVWKNLLILTFDAYDKQFVAALDKSNGKTVWKKDRAIKYPSNNGDYKKAFSTPSVFELDGRPHMVSPAAEATIAYDPETGQELWWVIHGGMNESMRPIRGHGLVYLNTGHTAQMLAVKEGGTGDRTKTGVVWKSNRGAPTRSSPLLVDDLLFMNSDGGMATCLDARSGKQAWQERLGGAFSSSPTYVDGHVYMSDEDGKTYVLKAGREYKIVAENKLDMGCMASAAVVGDDLLVRTKSHLYCIAAAR